jgi:predicted ribonuclease YlaK
VGLGFERGEMADKLKYWCAPAREAMERIQMSEENRKRVEAFPIDKTRGISVPAHEQMIFDEMQSAPTSLWDAAMTRAEEFGKVVLCGDTNQIDTINVKGLGMKRFLEAWKGTGAKDTLDRCQAEVHELQEQVGVADSLATNALMEKEA